MCWYEDVTMIDVVFAEEEVIQIVEQIVPYAIALLEDSGSDAERWDSARTVVAILKKIEAVYPELNKLGCAQEIVTLRAMVARRNSEIMAQKRTLKRAEPS